MKFDFVKRMGYRERKTIGILTQPLGHNYGGVLQNWALQKILYRLGFAPITIVYYGLPQSRQLISDIHSIVSYIYKHLLFLNTRNSVSVPWDRKNPLENLYKFLKQQTIRTKVIKNITSTHLQKYNIEALLIGSDQVWRPKYNNGSLDLMYGKLVDSGRKFPLIAYAASFGVDDWEYNDTQTMLAREQLKKFSYVSVREISGIQLCKKHLQVDAKSVLDPTMLLSRDDYVELLQIDQTNQSYKNKVGIYILDPTSNKQSIVKSICKSLNLEPVYFGVCDHNTGKFDKIETWLSAIECAEFIITDSFHGTAFSINFNKPFISITNSKRGSTRITSILQTFGLESQLVDEESEIIEEVKTKGAIDWIHVNELLKTYRSKSISELQSALNI